MVLVVAAAVAAAAEMAVNIVFDTGYIAAEVAVYIFAVVVVAAAVLKAAAAVSLRRR